MDIPLINQVCGPYRKLWTEFFSMPYGPGMKCMSYKKRRKQGSITYGIDQANEVIRCYYMAINVQTRLSVKFVVSATIS